ncbi:MAG TPA: 2Fe-2S iron-sulfur cluster-binding protein [Candidatus Bilamarchaeaceae archaeon]|nr:2Fe-2S iron-sulfur cluster-binding protein [Candidatus Bilamarchaeaceae archaeon]
MAIVHVKNDGENVEVPDGSQLDILDGKSSVLFACKSGTCASCKCRVLEGMENLEEPNDLEKEGLENFAETDKDRLMCQAKIKKGKITIEY